MSELITAILAFNLKFTEKDIKTWKDAPTTCHVKLKGVRTGRITSKGVPTLTSNLTPRAGVNPTIRSMESQNLNATK